MYAADFNYYRAGSVAEAGDLLRKNPGAKLLAGGHSLGYIKTVINARAGPVDPTAEATSISNGEPR